MTDLPDATAMASAVRNGEVTPAELLEQAIARADAVDPAINSVIHRRDEAALKEAVAEAGPGRDVGPFRGVPFLTKDLGCLMEGEPHHQGCAALRRVDARAPHDDYLYRRFREAGLVTFGRTNTPEFGATITTEPVAFGPSRNPYDLDHSTGGSSGGAAAAVAAGIVPMAHASDGGGSIRIPASMCGLIGLKPSRGRVSFGPDLGEAWAGAAIHGVVSRSVRDTAAALDAISEPFPGDPYIAPPPGRPFAAEVGADPGTLRVGLCAESGWGHVDPECVAAVEATGRTLESLGHHVEADRPPAMDDDEFRERFYDLVSAASARSAEMMATVLDRPLQPDDVEPDNWFTIERGRDISATDYLANLTWMHWFTRRVVAWWADGFDILVTPTVAEPPPVIGELRHPETGRRRLLDLLKFTSQFNVTGQPAVSLPLHRTPAGLPVGVQLVGPQWDEAMLIRLASQLEAAGAWQLPRPALWAPDLA